MKKKFNPRQPVSIYNEWPADKYPIRKGRAVWFVWNTLQLECGHIAWYHPARHRDRSFVISPGADFYKVKIRGDNEAVHVSAKWVQPKTQAGRKNLLRACIVRARLRLEDEKVAFEERKWRLESEITALERLLGPTTKKTRK
jgi:hypothetical protein